jgi:hypothetical protein
MKPDPVRLKEVHFHGISVAPYTMQITLEGQVRVRNDAYQKEVTLIYSTRESGSEVWSKVPCSYLSAGEDGTEIWEFCLGLKTYKGGIEQFCFQVRMNGREYWDNNGNRNYKIIDFI